MSADGSSPNDGRPAASDRTPRRKRRLLLGTGVLVVAVLGALAWLLFTGLKARTQLEAVRAEVRQLRAQIAAGELGAARTTATDLGKHAARAHELTSGLVWTVAAAVPYLGAPANTVRILTRSVDSVAANALPSLIVASDQLDPTKLRRPDGSIDLAPIRRVAPTLGTAAATMNAALARIDGSPASTWLGTVDSARADVLGQLVRLTSTVTSADVAANTVPALLGEAGPRTYLVSFQNEAELRGTGGLPGAFAIVRANAGKISFSRFESDVALIGQPANLNFGSQYNQIYEHDNPTKEYLDSNVSPHFPYAAQIWLAQWQHKTGQRLDGAITLDPTALSYLLAVTGPAKLPDGSTVSAGNVVQLTQQTAYNRFVTNNNARKTFLLDIARAASAKLIDSKASSNALVRAAARAVGEHRLLLWSSDRSVEAQLQRTSISGVVPRTSAPYIGLALNNAMAGKLDYYLHAALDWTRGGCGSARDVTVTITLRNDAPPGLPGYVLGFVGVRGFPDVKGTNRTVVDYYASAGAIMTSAEVNGSPAGASVGLEQGHSVYSVLLTLPTGVKQTIVLHLKEPAGSGPVIVRPQPMVNPMSVSVHDSSCN